jgi:hypothetical protein
MCNCRSPRRSGQFAGIGPDGIAGGGSFELARSFPVFGAAPSRDIITTSAN